MSRRGAGRGDRIRGRGLCAMSGVSLTRIVCVLGLTVKERHDEESSVMRGELVRIANVAHRCQEV